MSSDERIGIIPMAVYFVTLLLITLFGFLAKSSDQQVIVDENDNARLFHSSNTAFFYFLLTSVLIVVAGCRYYVGTDFGAYYRGYKESILNLPISIRKLDEPGFGILSWVATRFYDDGFSVMFTASLVTVVLPMIVIYRYSDELLITSILYLTTCWIGSFNGVKQFLACSFMFCGFTALRNKKFVQYMIWCSIAFLFHRSAIVMLLMYPAVHRKVNITNILLMVAVAGVVLASYDRVFSFANLIMDSNYSMENIYTSTQVNRIRVIAACVPAIVFLIEYYGKELSESQTFYLNLTILHAAIRLFTMNSALLYRIGLYTSLFQILAIEKLLKDIEGSNRWVITLGIIVMMLGMWWYEIYKNPSLSQFQWIWQR